MHRINKIVFKNFKFFHNQETTVNINEKNLLLYGENGSGKSSIYWGLFTLFQSVYKEKKDVEAYFEANGKFSLANSNMDSNDDSYVKLLLSKEGSDEKDSIISFDEVNTKETGRLVKDFAKYASFINFKSLFNHHNFLHREEIDLFPLFDYDILHSTSFGIEAESLEGNEFRSSNDVWSEIKAKKIYYYGLPGEEEANAEEEDRFDELINQFNTSFENYLEKINEILDSLLEKSFHYNFKVKISFEGISKFNHPEVYTMATPPVISLKITENSKPIHKPQSYLNEAKLTALALAIKFAVVLEKYKDKEGIKLPKLLILDDIMISMDMGNRLKVIQLLTNRFKDFQILIFTHDRSLYNYIWMHLKHNTKEDKWLRNEIYNHTLEESEYPVLYEIEKNKEIKKAEYYLSKHDYPASAIYLRKLCEEKLITILPNNFSNKVKKEDFNGNGITENLELHLLIINFIKYCELENIPFDDFKNLIIHKSAILNSLAHNDITSPIYRHELIDILDCIKNLDNICIKEVLKAGKDISIKYSYPEGDDLMIGCRLKDSLRFIYFKGSPLNYSNTTKILLQKIEVNNEVLWDENQEFENLTKLYSFLKDFIPHPDFSYESNLYYRNSLIKIPSL